MARSARRRALAETGPHLTVQIATRNRTASLRRCLDSLAGLDYHSFEVLVIDNAPSSGDTRAMVHGVGAGPSVGTGALPARARARRVRALNRGLEVAAGEWVVRTDDDVVVDPQWLAAIAEAATSAPDVECVTGLILPAEIDTPAQELLEQFGGYARGFRHPPGRPRRAPADRPAVPVHHRADGQRRQHRVATPRACGPAVGLTQRSAPARGPTGGEDLLALYDVLTGGGAVVYEPSTLVWHWNRRDYVSLRRLTHDYGVGLTAYLTAAAVRRPGLALGMARHAVLGVRHVIGRSSPKNLAPRGASTRGSWSAASCSA